MKVTLLSKEGCTMCDVAEQLVNDANLSYTKRIVDRETLQEICGRSVSTYPQIMIDNNHIGDNFDLEEYLDQSYEPLLDQNNNRFTVFPIKHHNLWQLYKKSQMSNWTAEEVDLSKDMDDWNLLSEGEHHFIKMILAFFASSDGIVFENISVNFANEVQVPEARSFYAYQSHNEMVHGETYSLLIDKYITDPKEKSDTFMAIETIPCIKQKAEWAFKWFDSSVPFGDRLIAFACVEGIFFSGSFCAIFWLKKRGLMPGLSFSNELISRDEAMHLEFAIELFAMLNHKSSQQSVHAIVSEAVAIETSFITDALPCALIGMNAQKMSTYIEFVADRMLKQLGYDPIWRVENPFDFMENISMDGKTNFFEKRVGDYAKFSNEGAITFDDDF